MVADLAIFLTASMTVIGLDIATATFRDDKIGLARNAGELLLLDARITGRLAANKVEAVARWRKHHWPGLNQRKTGQRPGV